MAYGLTFQGNVFRSIPRQAIEKGTKAILDHLKTRVTSDKLAQLEPDISKSSAFSSSNDSSIQNAQHSGKYVANNMKLTELPNSILTIENLTKISVQKNLISEIPVSIGQLANLTSLDLQANKISVIPKEISGCIALTEIDISSNQISSIDPICSLSHLKIINFINNKVKELPSNLFLLPNIWSVSAAVNQISQIPSSIKNASSLEILNLSSNKVIR